MTPERFFIKQGQDFNYTPHKMPEGVWGVEAWFCEHHADELQVRLVLDHRVGGVVIHTLISLN